MGGADSKDSTDLNDDNGYEGDGGITAPLSHNRSNTLLINCLRGAWAHQNFAINFEIMNPGIASSKLCGFDIPRTIFSILAAPSLGNARQRGSA